MTEILLFCKPFVVGFRCLAVTFTVEGIFEENNEPKVVKMYNDKNLYAIYCSRIKEATSRLFSHGNRSAWMVIRGARHSLI
jgi:hypothetical protein